MFKIFKEEQNNYILSSNKNKIKSNLKFETFFPINLEHKLYSTCINSEKEQLDFNEKNETCLYSLNNDIKGRKTLQKDFLGKKTLFKINLENNKKDNKFITVRTQKNSERWNKVERFKFLEGIYKFGCNWKVINKKFVESRTAIQVRSHAQKFILHLRKFKDDSLGIDFTTNIYDDREKLLNKFREIINNNEKGNMLMVLTNKLCKRNMLTEKLNHKDNSNNLNGNHKIIHKNFDFSETKEEKSKIFGEKNFHNSFLDNDIFAYKSNLNLNNSDFNDNIESNKFLNNCIEYDDILIDKSSKGFNDILIINKIEYNNMDLLINDKHFKENEYIQNITISNITYWEELNKKYIINKKETKIDY